jgi:phosphofurin acidic cluster sorting protein 2
MVFTRLIFTKTLVETENTPITIAVRLQNNRRILRSNDLSIFPSRLDTPLDISFTIQYCHFIKRKLNVLQILIQRRKRYKNRQIPGFKTLAMGHLNLDEILQFGGSREVIIWDTTCLRQKARHSMRGKIQLLKFNTLLKL